MLFQLKDYISGLGRKFAKGLNTALLHGGGSNAMANSIIAESEIKDLDSSIVKNIAIRALEEAYGPEWSIPHEIALLGKAINAKGNSLIEWTMPDGFQSTSVSYTMDTKVECTSFNISTNKKSKATVTAIMPTLSSGSTLIDAHCGVVKVNGLYANIIHSIDSYFMRQTYERCSFEFTDILDKWKLRGEHIDELFEVQYTLLEEIQPLLQDILNQITSKYGVKEFILPNGGEELVKTNNWLAS